MSVRSLGRAQEHAILVALRAMSHGLHGGWVLYGGYRAVRKVTVVSLARRGLVTMRRGLYTQPGHGEYKLTLAGSVAAETVRQSRDEKIEKRMAARSGGG